MLNRGRRGQRSRSVGPDIKKTNSEELSTSPEVLHSNELKDLKETKIYVGNLPEALSTNESFKDNFTKFGEIINSYIVIKDDGFKYGFVSYRTMKEAMKAISKSNRKPPHEKLIVKIANVKPDAADTPTSSSIPNGHSPEGQRNHKIKKSAKKRMDIFRNNQSGDISDSSLDSELDFYVVPPKTECNNIMPTCTNCSNQFVKCDCGKWYCNKECQNKDLENHQLICTSILSLKQINKNEQESLNDSNELETSEEKLNNTVSEIENTPDNNTTVNFIDKLNEVKKILKDQNVETAPKAKKVTFSTEKDDTAENEKTSEVTCNSKNADVVEVLETRLPLQDDRELWETLAELIIGEEITAAVQYVKEDFAWITDVKNNAIISYLQMYANYEADKGTLLRNITPGSLCLVNHENEWYRSVITDTNSAFTSVRLLEFGQIVTVKENDKLIEVVDAELRTEPPFAVKVRLASRSTTKLEEGKIYEIKPTEQIDDHFVVVVKGHEPQDIIEIKNKIKSPFDFLLSDGEGTLKIEHRFSSNEATATLETSEIEQLTADFISAHPIKLDQVQVNDFVLVKFPLITMQWGRGKVVGTVEGKYVVSLCDLGKIIHCDEVYVLPENHLHTPPQSCNLKIKNFITKDCIKYLKFIKKFMYKVVQTEPTIEIICSIDDKSKDIFRAEVIPWYPSIEQYGQHIFSMSMAKASKNVKVFNVKNLNTIYIMNQENIMKYDDLLNNVKQYSKTVKALDDVSVKRLIALPMKNEMVLCQNYADENYSRAIVTDVRNEKYIKVLFTETGTEEVVSFDKLLELSDELKSEPVYLLKVKLWNVPNVQNDEALSFLANSDQIFTMKLVEELFVELFYEDGTTLNNKITHLLIEPEVILLHENTFLPIAVGKNAEILIVNNTQLKAFGEVFATVSNVEHTDFLEEILKDLHAELNAAYENTKAGHMPIVNEVCVANFPDDSWSRAVCLKIGTKATKKFLLQSLDCGGLSWIKSSYIRKMDKKFLAKPYLASKITIKDITIPIPQKQLSVLENHFEIGGEVSGYITKVSEGNYSMKLPPDIFKQLQLIRN